MNLRVIPEKVIRITAEQCYAGLVVKTNEQGIEVIYAIKTLPNSSKPAEVKVKYADGWQVIDPKSCTDVTAIFAEFLDIMNGRFQTSNQIAPRPRCYAILTDGIVKNRDPNAALTIKHYDGIVDNEFIKVDMDEFQRRPLDLSSDWEMFEPTSQHKAKIKNLVSGTNRYLGKKTTAIKLQSRRNSSTGVF